jgi:hypothetical protein
MKHLKKIWILSSALFLWGCENESKIQISDYSYFPVEVGQYQVYEVTETRYNISDPNITSKFYIKEQVSEVYVNQLNEKIYKVERLKKQDINQLWKIDSVWTAQLFVNKAIRTESNLSTIKLFFPIQDGQAWNRNELNNNKPQNAKYQNKGKDYAIDSKVYQNTVSVVIKNDSSLLTKNVHLEVYAPSYGLILRENTHLAYCQSSPACIGKGQIDFGIRQTSKLIEMGLTK